mgnify:CR=1 FL=1
MSNELSVLLQSNPALVGTGLDEDTLAVAVYPTGAWSVTDSLGANANIVAAVNAALTAAGTANTTTGAATATFTN